MPLIKFTILLTTLLSTVITATEGTTPSCSNTNSGAWFHLKTATSLEVTKDCQFKYTGPNCNSSGQLSEPLNEQGEIKFKTNSINDDASCQIHGEKSCKYVLLNQEMILDCEGKEHESYIKEKENLNVKRLSEDAADEYKNAQRELASHYLSTNQAKKAAPLLLEMAKKKDADAISALGLVKFYGSNGFKKNTAESLKWNQLAAENGSSEAKYILGNHYYRGLGVKKSYPEARELYQQAALENNIPAQKALAHMWNEGVEGVVKKYDTKFWLNKAIALGDAEAAYMLAHLDDAPVRNIAQETPPPVKAEPVKPKEELKTPVVVKTPPALQPENVVVKVDRGYRYFDSIFLVKPYFLLQERQGAIPSVALGITPRLQIGEISIKMQASVSLLNMALGDTFAAFDVATVLGFKVDTLFYEMGYGFDFWPEPSGTAQLVSVSVGKILTQDLLGMFPLKTISFGISQTFFEDRTYKFFIATSF